MVALDGFGAEVLQTDEQGALAVGGDVGVGARSKVAGGDAPLDGIE